MTGEAKRTLDPAIVAAYADAVTAPREAFAQAFDQATAEPADGRYLDFKMTALGVTDERAAFRAAFVKAAERGCLDALVAGLVQRGHLDLAGMLIAGDPALGGAERLGLTPQDATGLTINPQGWNADMMNFVRVDDMVRGLLTAMRRVCEVQIDGVGKGSGFLVGPQTLLTNWHVVHDLIDATTGLAKAGSGARLTCLFDNFGARSGGVPHTAVEGWLVAWSPLDVHGATVTGNYPDMTALKPSPWLDFAVIRLGGAPGRSRGAYDLTAAGSVPTAGDPRINQLPFFVIQHPAQYPQQLSVATGAHLVAANPRQIKHMAAALSGSSGGLCLNEKFAVVGLHQAQVTRQVNGVPAFDHNLAIAATAIAAAAPTFATVDTQHDAIWVTRRNEKAVVGRVETLAKIAAMRDATTTKPILVVRGRLGSGRTFTTELIEDRIEQAQQWFAKLDAANLPAHARDLALLILEQAAVKESDRERLPVPADAGTTDIAWIKVLAQSFRQLLSEAAAGRILWIVLENLDAVDVTQTGARKFLDVLYDMVPSSPMMRVVLLGLSGNLPSGDPDSAVYDDLRTPDRLEENEVKTFIASVCADRNIPVQPDEISRLAQLAMSAASELRAGDSADLRLTRLGEFLSKVLYASAKGWK